MSTTIDAALRQARQIEKEIQEFVATVNGVLEWVPDYLRHYVKPILDMMNRLSRKVAEFWAKIKPYLDVTGSPRKLRRHAAALINNVARPLNDIAGDIAIENLESNTDWTGSGAEAYKAVVPVQGDSLGDLRDFTNELGNTLKEIATAIENFWLAIGLALAALVVGFVAAIAEAGTVVGVFLSIPTALGAIGLFLAAFTTAVIELKSIYDTIDTSQDRINQGIVQLGTEWAKATPRNQLKIGTPERWRPVDGWPGLPPRVPPAPPERPIMPLPVLPPPGEGVTPPFIPEPPVVRPLPVPTPEPPVARPLPVPTPEPPVAWPLPMPAPEPPFFPEPIGPPDLRTPPFFPDPKPVTPPYFPGPIVDPPEEDLRTPPFFPPPVPEPGPDVPLPWTGEGPRLDGTDPSFAPGTTTPSGAVAGSGGGVTQTPLSGTGGAAVVAGGIPGMGTSRATSGRPGPVTAGTQPERPAGAARGASGGPTQGGLAGAGLPLGAVGKGDEDKEHTNKWRVQGQLFDETDPTSQFGGVVGTDPAQNPKKR